MDPVTLGLIIGGGSLLGNVVGGLFGSSAQNSANQTNMAISNQQMGFQEYMSNTAYQRSMADMKAAGLNPMLAFMKGGASTPPGSTTQVDAVNPMSGVASGLNAGISNALSVMNTRADLENKGAMKALTDAQTVTEASKALATSNAAEESRLRAAKLTAELPADSEEAKVRKARAEFDMGAATYDNIMKRVQQAAGIGSSAMDMMPGILNLLRKTGSGKMPKEIESLQDFLMKRIP